VDSGSFQLVVSLLGFEVGPGISFDHTCGFDIVALRIDDKSRVIGLAAHLFSIKRFTVVGPAVKSSTMQLAQSLLHG
jgi:hypothetical protein